MGTDWRDDRVASAADGTNPTVLMHLDGGYAVIGDVQFLPGYCVLLTDVPGTDRLTDLPRARRVAFLSSMELLSEAVEIVCGRRDAAFRRMNLEIQGNELPLLHAHLWPRYDWEPEDLVHGAVGGYPVTSWSNIDHRLGARHDQLRSELCSELNRLVL